MHQLRIAALNPELPALESTLFKAAVTLIWPYSSSARQLALLLAEPDFRLRRKKGQVRARFSGSSAKALATTGVGIGDEVILSLRGAQFVQEGTVSTPGKSIDWELSYSQTVRVRIFRNGAEIANLDLIDVTPTPAPPSPIRHDPIHVSARKWSSPAFLKRVRLSDGPFFENPYDPLVDDTEKGHDKKRQRKSYRDWKAWTYNARIPSPEKEDTNIKDNFEALEPSPSRPTKLPDTPVSPVEPEAPSATAHLLDPIKYVEKAHEWKQQPNDVMSDTDYYEFYAGPNELPLADTPYAFGGDTEVDTEENTEEEDTQAEVDVVSVSATEADTEVLEDDLLHPIEKGTSEAESATSEEGIAREVIHTTTEEDSSIEIFREPEPEDAMGEADGDGVDLRQPSVQVPLRIAMPPPALLSLQTDFPATSTSNLLTPIGREPASPTLQPLNSATLPLPSPFPGELSADNLSSFLDQVTTGTQSVNAESPVVGEQPLNDASYILETSFFSSINSSKPSTLHPNHETAFAPVRFTFGTDGNSSSKVEGPSSLEAEEHLVDTDNGVSDRIEGSENLVIDLLGSGSDGHATVLAPEKSNGEVDVDRIEDSPSGQIEGPLEVEKKSDIVQNASNVEAQADFIEIIHDESIDMSSDQYQAKSSGATLTGMGTSQFVEESAFIDLELLSEDDNNQDGTVVKAQTVNIGTSKFSEEKEQLISTTPNPSSMDRHQDVMLKNIDVVQLINFASFADLVNMGSAAEASNQVRSIEGQAQSNTQSQQRTDENINQPARKQFLNTDELTPELIMTDSDVNMESANMRDQVATSSWDLSDMLERHQDVNVESIEERSLFPMQQSSSKVVDNPPSEQLIAASKERNRRKETHAISIPPASPVRNTRSRGKAAVMPDQEEAHVTRRTTRSHRSKASVTSIARSSISPPRTATQSTLSPAQSSSQTSPYRLRSHSKPHSPTQVISAITHRKSRKHASQGSMGSISDFGASQKELDDVFNSSNELSQHHYTSQVDPVDVRKSSLRTKYSKFAVPDSDAQDDGTKPIDAPVDDTSDLSTAQPAVDSLSEKLSSKNPPEVTLPGSRNLRRTRRRIYGLSPEPQNPIEETAENTTVQAQRKTRKQADPQKLIEGQPGESQLSSLLPPSAVNMEQPTHGITRAAASAFPSRNESLPKDSNHLITPEATQQSTVDSQPGFHIEQYRQELPVTPQLTQTSSAGLQLLQNNAEIKPSAIEGPVTFPNIIKSTPRRNVTATDVASASASPKSPDASSSPDVARSQMPSIGLSTSSAYYTSLRDLVFYLNRSSQFHSSANPDLLALVTSPATTPQRATKGPKHWNTSLHITDLSMWPSITTVNVFRAYQTALPQADIGDIILLRAFAVKSLNRQPALISTDESSWCVWRYGKPMWNGQKGSFSEIEAREEMRGPNVEKGDGELHEVGRLRNWYVCSVKSELQQREESQVKTRSKDKMQDEEGNNEAPSVVPESKDDDGIKTRSRNRKSRVIGTTKS